MNEGGNNHFKARDNYSASGGDLLRDRPIQFRRGDSDLHDGDMFVRGGHDFPRPGDEFLRDGNMFLRR